jgi:hypothetical protein
VYRYFRTRHTEINKKPAYFINDKLVNESILKTLRLIENNNLLLQKYYKELGK